VQKQKEQSHSKAATSEELITKDIDISKIIKIQAIYRGQKARLMIQQMKK